MPTYDYVCANCGYEVEVMHSVHGRGPSTCRSCGGPMKKAIVAPAFHFKGSGWARKELTGPSKSIRPSSAEPAGSAVGGDSPAGAGGDPPAKAAAEQPKADPADSAAKKAG